MSRIGSGLLCLLVCGAGLTLSAQEQTSRAREARYQEILDEAFVSRTPWIRDWKEAQELAATKDQLILAYFTGSEPAPSACRELQAGPLVSEWWVELSARFVPYLNIATGLADTPDPGVLAQKGAGEIPHLVFLDSSGAVLGPRIWPESQAVVEQAQADALEQLAQLDALREAVAAAPGDAVAMAKLRIHLGLRWASGVTAQELEQLAGTVGIDPELANRVRVFLCAAQVRERFRQAKIALRSGTPRRQVMIDLRAGCLALYKGGLRLPLGHRRRLDYQRAAFDGAIAAKLKQPAAELLVVCTEDLRRVVATEPREQERIAAEIEHMKAMLDRLESAQSGH